MAVHRWTKTVRLPVQAPPCAGAGPAAAAERVGGAPAARRVLPRGADRHPERERRAQRGGRPAHPLEVIGSPRLCPPAAMVRRAVRR